MAKESTDVTTIDLFCDEKRSGRPKSNPLPRSVQIKINKRNQVKRDKHNGLKRIECKLHFSLFEQLENLAQDQKTSRSKLIESLLIESLANRLNKTV